MPAAFRSPLLALFLAWLLWPAAGWALDLAAFERDFALILAEEGVPGGAFAVVQGPRVIHAAGFGVQRAGDLTPVDPETVFRLASVSKPFAGQLTGLIVRDGYLSWDDPVNRFLPEFRLRQPGHADQLRIHHLLSHTAGVVSNAYDNMLNDSQPLERILPRFADLDPVCQPGSCYTYQNVLFALVGPAIEHGTGRAFDELLRERIFVPLGMHQASIGSAGYQAASNRATPHVRRGERWLPTEVNENYYRVGPAAGINASALDLGQWLTAQLGFRPDVIPPELVIETTEPRTRTLRDLRRRGWRDLLDDAHYGLGWRIYTVGGERIVLHSGWVRGFMADVAFAPERGIGLAVLINAESGVLNDITTLFWRQVLATPQWMADGSSGAESPAAGVSMGGD